MCEVLFYLPLSKGRGAGERDLRVLQSEEKTISTQNVKKCKYEFEIG